MKKQINTKTVNNINYMKYLFISILILSINIKLFSQEIISPLEGNSILQNQKILKVKLLENVFLELPFFDDFSNSLIFPNSSLWADNYVFIDNQYSLHTPSIGVAVFDAINDKGNIYSTANPYTFSADTLTSQYIRLDSITSPIAKEITIADSLYFSFYFQPGGGLGHPWERVGDVPEKDDSLLLQFYFASADTIYLLDDTIYYAPVWKTVWSHAGMSLDTFYTKYGTYFKQIMIPIKDTNYIKKDFRFRFRNYASLGNNMVPSWAGNSDQWYVDYVYLNIGRTISDSTYKDIAFSSPAKSLLKNYQSMPWNQFKVAPSAEMNSYVQSIYHNLYNETRQANRNFQITDLQGSTGDYNSTGGNANINGLSDSTFTPPFTYTFNSNAIPYADFEVLYAINTSPDVNRNNDTIRFIQKFYNYYAYDDGVPENGYGLSPSGARLAYRFSLNVEDTLRSVDMFFNRTYNDASQQFFYLTIWDNISGKPGNIIYDNLYAKPEYENELNKFHTYILPSPIVVSDTIYIGWTQTTADNLNIGFDRNNFAEENIFYNTDGVWYPSMYKGALMIRPIFGSENLPHVGICDNKKKIDFNIYPNPANSYINISGISDISDYKIEIYDIIGNKILSEIGNQTIFTNSLNAGVYLVRIMAIDGTSLYKQLIINR